MFLHTKDLGCKGDSSTDDTAAFQAALYASLGKILFVDAGLYILTSTITIPPKAKIVDFKLYSTASEHAVFYQYNFHSAANIFAGMLQTESPYFQPTPPPPAPFAAVVGLLPGDPDYTCAAGNEFNGCDQSWSVVMTGSANIFIVSAGIYTALMLLKDNLANVRFQNLVTIGAKFMAVMDGKGIPAIDNLNVDTHPSWSQVSVLDVGSNGTTRFDEAIWIDPAIWDMDEPKFTCSPPSNVNQGTWISTITQAPLTITEWVLEPVTITRDAAAVNKNKRDAGVEIWPVPATTPFWPAILYRGDDGQISTTSATGTFPKPAATPLSGSWPKKAVRAVWGWPENPLVDECDFYDFNCVPKPWFGGTVGDPGGDDFYDDENAAELRTICPEETSTSSTSPKPTPTKISPTVAVPIPAPVYQQGDPRLNTKKCFKGEQTENVRMRNATTRFCDDIAHRDLIAGFEYEKEYKFEYNGGIGFVGITVSLEIKPKCSFNYSKSLCQRYLSVPTDSCDCNGVNGKHGGTVENNCYKWKVDPNRR
ncbi:hypothetical protein QBC32DRAFT_325051 [Pseudoneurospora amorphoporcata]|uniref:Glycoside hydrolase family 55 protein n=1 Tax=Pseudoneurospora amorphoporcata TaxID=241081 RepID=A0AAN6NWX5_9PEZI|nr:hypothetical protein QBC32DRAFT_325051 [Pseudoneurospora amorphoporcata]